MNKEDIEKRIIEDLSSLPPCTRSTLCMAVIGGVMMDIPSQRHSAFLMEMSNVILDSLKKHREELAAKE